MAINNYSKYNSSTYPMSGQDDPVYQFATKYRLQNLQVESNVMDIDFYKSSYKVPMMSTVVIKMGQGAFQSMVRADEYSSELYHELRKEATLRHNHPALQDAWEKYQMLLALVKE